MHAIGRHIILEMWGCSNLNSLESAEDALREMVVALDVHLLDLKVYPFSPVGVTGVAIVSESHLVIHTWPEFGYAAVDVFTCGARSEPEAAVSVLRGHFEPDRVQAMEMTRGQLAAGRPPGGRSRARSSEASDPEESFSTTVSWTPPTAVSA